MSKRHVFLIRWDEDGLCMDAFASCDWHYGPGNSYRDIEAAKVLAGDAGIEATREVDEFLRQVACMQMRVRFSGCEGPFVLIDEQGDLDRETIESALRHMPKEKRRAWLRSAKM